MEGAGGAQALGTQMVVGVGHTVGGPGSSHAERSFQRLGKEVWAVTDGDAWGLKVEILASASVDLEGASCRS